MWTLLLLFLLRTIPVLSFEDSRYHKYPTGLVPIADTGDYSLVEPPQVVMDMLKEDALTAYKFSNIVKGFVFDANGTATKLLVQARIQNFTNDWGQLRVVTDQSEFYEQLPTLFDNEVFVSKFFEYTIYKKQRRVDSKCLIPPGVLRDRDLRDTCTRTPRCIGFIPRHCIISSVDRDKLLGEYTNTYYEKRRQHNVLRKIDNHPIAFWLAYITAVVTLTLFPEWKIAL